MFPIGDDNPASSRPVLTLTFIGICVAVFLYQITLPPAQAEAFVFRWGFIPGDVLGPGGLEADDVPAWSKIFTSMFLHGDFMHIIGNMLFLWIFGNNIEDTFGKPRFAIFYLLCGVAAAFTQAVTDTASGVPMIGASGAISGVLGAYLLLFPHARVRVLVMFGIITVVHMRAIVVLGLWFVLQLVNAALAPVGEEGGVAFWAHVGGFVAGMVLMPVFRPARPRVRGPWG
ncbi:MAG: rhomboid family intramembrane serine protease [Reyranellaceae bacterium]